MENTVQSLNEIFEIIAKTLGYSVEFVKENGMEYLLEYGRYSYVSSIFTNLLLGLALAFVVVMAVGFGLQAFDVIDETNKKMYDRILVFIFIVVLFSPLLDETVRYASSPIIYSTEKASELINNTHNN